MNFFYQQENNVNQGNYTDVMMCCAWVSIKKLNKKRSSQSTSVKYENFSTEDNHAILIVIKERKLILT